MERNASGGEIKCPVKAALCGTEIKLEIEDDTSPKSGVLMSFRGEGRSMISRTLQESSKNLAVFEILKMSSFKNYTEQMEERVDPAKMRLGLIWITKARENKAARKHQGSRIDHEQETRSEKR
ncbi:hypothetical protein Esti_003613 [Eimeria stiedai]